MCMRAFESALISVVARVCVILFVRKWMFVCAFSCACM